MKDGELINKTNGYAAVRLNAVRHGILSRETVLPHESRQDFEFLLNELQNEKKPWSKSLHPFYGESAVCSRPKELKSIAGLLA